MNKLTKFLIFSTVFLIPSYLIRFSIFGIPTNVLEILIYLTFLSWILENPDINFKGLYQEYKLYIFSIGLIFLGLTLSTLINQNYREGFGIIKGWFFDPILFSFILANKIKKQEDIENILKVFYFSASSVSLIALGYLFSGHLTYDGRLSAFYSSPNYLAMFLAPAVFIGTWNKFNKIFNFSSLAVILATIYFTHSYAAWIAIILSLLIAGIITKKINRKLVLAFLAIILIAVISQISNPKLKNVFSDRSSAQSRVIIWKSSFKILKDNFIFGIGPGNFQNKYLEYQKYFPPYLEWAVPQPHNLYLAFWLQSGLLGFIGFISLVCLILKQATKNSSRVASAVFLGIIIYILIHGLLDTAYWKNDLSLIFWITTIFILSEYQINYSRSSR